MNSNTLHILIVPKGKKPAHSQQDSVYRLGDVKMKLLDKPYDVTVD